MRLEARERYVMRGGERRPRACQRAALELPDAVLLHELALDVELAAAAQILDHVPMHGALVLPADHREAVAHRKVDRSLDLLVEQRVSHVVLDAGVAADPEFA